MSASTRPGTYRDAGTAHEDGPGPIFPAVVLGTVGLFQFFEGLSAVLNDDVYVGTPNYVYEFDLTAWGWIHLVIGILCIGVSIAIVMGQVWAMIVGLLMATLSLVAQFLFIPWQPLWAVVIIGIDVLVAWSLAAGLRKAEPS